MESYERWFSISLLVWPLPFAVTNCGSVEIVLLNGLGDYSMNHHSRSNLNSGKKIAVVDVVKSKSDVEGSIF